MVVWILGKSNRSKVNPTYLIVLTHGYVSNHIPKKEAINLDYKA